MVLRLSVVIEGFAFGTDHCGVRTRVAELNSDEVSGSLDIARQSLEGLGGRGVSFGEVEGDVEAFVGRDAYDGVDRPLAVLACQTGRQADEVSDIDDYTVAGAGDNARNDSRNLELEFRLGRSCRRPGHTGFS
ncbi:MAG: hypothetical protein NC336_02165 [Clostridium sp.]|nr:hypothetical protein [Clostridium sp.]